MNTSSLIYEYLKKARKNPFLIRFTLGLRILLAIAFIPTAAVKLLGNRFTTGIPEKGSPLVLFEALYQSGLYWQFLGATQLLAGCLILFYRTTSIGALIFLGIALNILFITISYDFGLTIIVTSGITLAILWLLFWHWDTIRFLFILDSDINFTTLKKPVLNSRLERSVYITGFISGLILFSVLRGFKLPAIAVYTSIIVSIVSFILALILSVTKRNKI